MADSIANHPVVSPAEWLSARTALLGREKEFTRLRDDLARQRRALPWVKVEKAYVFEGPGGEQTLPQLFGASSQLVVYHFMFNPEWSEGCPHCSFWADHFDGMRAHLERRDVTLVAISRAPLAKIEPFRKRMGWKFNWLSSFRSEFNYDYQASFTPEEVQGGTAIYNFSPAAVGSPEREGVSVFRKHGAGEVFHTYSCYARGIDMLNGTYQVLDLTPKGRDEDGFESPQGWVRHHDRYGEG
jgi:predicted dithiol-disulfide oxidoreductase (DUF899 family)